MVQSALQLRGIACNRLWRHGLFESLQQLQVLYDKRYNFHVIAGYVVPVVGSYLKMIVLAEGGVLTSTRWQQRVALLSLGHDTDNKECFQGVELPGRKHRIQR